MFYIHLTLLCIHLYNTTIEHVIFYTLAKLYRFLLTTKKTACKHYKFNTNDKNIQYHCDLFCQYKTSPCRFIIKL